MDSFAVGAHVHPSQGCSGQNCRSPLGSYPVPEFPFWATPADGSTFIVRDVGVYVPGKPHRVEGLPQAAKDVSASLFGGVVVGDSPTLLQVSKSKVSSYKGPVCAPQGCHEI